MGLLVAWNKPQLVLRVNNVRVLNVKLEEQIESRTYVGQPVFACTLSSLTPPDIPTIDKNTLAYNCASPLLPLKTFL